MELEIGEEVDLVVGRFTHVGITVLINGTYEGMLYKNEVFQKVREGQKLKGYVKNLREDEKIDISLQPIGFLNKIDTNERFVLEGFIGVCKMKNDLVLLYRLTDEVDLSIGEKELFVEGNDSVFVNLNVDNYKTLTLEF